MPRRSVVMVVSAAVATFALLADSTRDVAAQDDVRGTRGGVASSIGATPVTEQHCHDGAKRIVQCFTTAAARDESWRASRRVRPLAIASNGYVIAWVHASYAGSSVILSQDYANLETIGWNDRISSYKVYTNLQGAFYEHSNYWGLTDFYCCFSQVSYVGDSLNDRFSSIDLP